MGSNNDAGRLVFLVRVKATTGLGVLFIVLATVSLQGVEPWSPLYVASL